MCECENVQVCKWLNEAFITERTKATFAHLHIDSWGGLPRFCHAFEKVTSKVVVGIDGFD